MSPELVALALPKQRLQIRSPEQREALVGHARAFAPVFGGIVRIADRVRWARDNAPILSGVAIFVLVAPPPPAPRRARPGWVGWQLLQRVRTLVS